VRQGVLAVSAQDTLHLKQWPIIMIGVILAKVIIDHQQQNVEPN
jgi:hypothetical protein